MKDELGAFWQKKSSKGITYFAGYVMQEGKKVNAVMFVNRSKKNPKEPDLRILLSESKPKQTGKVVLVDENGEVEDLPF